MGDKGGKNSERKGGSHQSVCIGEELKLAVEVALERFRLSDDQKQLEFPSSLTAKERAFVHRHCSDHGLKTKSRGKDSKRFLTVYKKEQVLDKSENALSLSKDSLRILSSYLEKFPISSKEKHDLSRSTKPAAATEQNKILVKENRLVLGNSPQVPPKSQNTTYKQSSSKLPIFKYKEEILDAIANNQVVLIAGETGSGKTTQVGQYILEECYRSDTPCRIMCTQPRRLSAISVAERVATERGESIGQTIGYQIRLESKLSQRTLLLYCTTGILLRLLMLGQKSLSNLTHIIVDEIHERDKFSDYLLICLRDLLKTYRNLKVVLMSAALNIELFQNYFGGCPLVQVPGHCYDVKVHYLEDLLRETGYMSNSMQKLMQEHDMNYNSEQPENSASSNKWTSAAWDVEKMIRESSKYPMMVPSDESPAKNAPSEKITDEKKDEKKEDNVFVDTVTRSEDKESDDDVIIEDEGEDEEIMKEMDGLRLREDLAQDNIVVDQRLLFKEMDTNLAQAWMSSDDEAFDQIIDLITNESVSVDYEHSETRMTALIVASAKGNLVLVEQLISLGASLDKRDPMNNRNALEWARHYNEEPVSEYLEGVSAAQQQAAGSEDTEEEGVVVQVDEFDRKRLDLYHKSFDDKNVDAQLIAFLIQHISRDPDALPGAILVFLPGYDDIINVRDRLASDEANKSKFQILLLHSMLQPSNQRRVFLKPPDGTRKIILSTNIAETSLTIDDVVYVIDSGKVKEKAHDALSSVSCLRSVWISKASAVQRKGRSGRTREGICYHLYSRERFQHFSLYQDAEILRVPIHELCLQTKMLDKDVSISDYLAKAPEPPPYLMIRNSIQLLKTISALDDNEDMTELGKLLVELPIDPQLGKIILFGLTMKCLEPAVIIASYLSYKEPFVLPSMSSQKSAAIENKQKFSADSMSDHVAMLRAFQGYQLARKEGHEKFYCLKNFLSSGTMEMIFATRTQLISQLRSLGLVKHQGRGDARDLNTNASNWAVIKAVVGAGLYPKIVRVDRAKGQMLTDKDKKVSIHTSSVIGQRSDNRSLRLKKTIDSLPFDWLAYEELSKLYYSVQIRSVSMLSALAVALLAGPSLSFDEASVHIQSSVRPTNGRTNGEAGKLEPDSESADGADKEEGSDSEQEGAVDADIGSLRVDDWISLQAGNDVLNTVSSIRIKLLTLLVKRIQMPPRAWNYQDDQLVQCVAHVLAKEEQLVGLRCPANLSEPPPMQRKLYHARDQQQDGKFAGDENVESDGSDHAFQHSNLESRGIQRGGRGRGRGRGRGGRDERSEYGRDGGDELSHNKGKRYGRGGNAGYRGDDTRRGRWSGRKNQDDQKRFEYQYESSEDSERSTRHRPTRYFIVKCNNERNLEISVDRQVWATTKTNEKKLQVAYENSDTVLLIFSVQGSGHFQGVVKMLSAVGEKLCDEFGSSSNLGGAFDVEWLHRENIPFHCTQHLTNPWNENKKVQISRDCQEVEPSVGEKICQLWEHVSVAAPGVQPIPVLSASNQPVHPLQWQAEAVRSSDDVGSVIQRDEEDFYPGVMYEGEEQPFIPDGYPPMFGAPFSPQHMQAPGGGEFMPPPHFTAPPHMFPPSHQYPLYTQHARSTQDYRTPHPDSHYFGVQPPSPVRPDMRAAGPTEILQRGQFPPPPEPPLIQHTNQLQHSFEV